MKFLEIDKILVYEEFSVEIDISIESVGAYIENKLELMKEQ